MDLAGRVAIVTGAGSGIGQGLAVGLANSGMKLVLAGHNENNLRGTAKLVSDLGAECICVTADVSQLGDVQQIAEKALERFGQIHVLCNVAGVGPFGTVPETSMEDWRWVLSVNLWGPIHGVHVFLPIMEKQGVGHICSVASESGLYGTSFLAAYNVSKFGVVGLMQSLARDLRVSGSPVNASVFCPGAIKTNIIDSARNEPSAVRAEHSESEATRVFKSMVEQIVADGMDPNESAKIVIDAIKRDQFWIFSHPHVPETALRQAAAMAENSSLIDL
ncbi:MAG: SDR family NAD(P)-dependent oxidoreductase [Pseudomonadota bacterium]